MGRRSAPPQGEKSPPQMKHLVLLLLLMPLSALSEDLLRHSANRDRMGTTYTVIAYGENRAKLQTAVNKPLEEADRTNSLLSDYREDNERSRINREAGDEPVRTTNGLLAMCIDYSRSSEGAFDISFGPLKKNWGSYRLRRKAGR